jgi:hypothetical protein
VQGHRILASDGLEIWFGILSNNCNVLILFNRSPKKAFITARWRDLGKFVNFALICFLLVGIPPTQKFVARDLWQHQDLGMM